MYSQVTPPRLACCMFISQFQGVWCVAVWTQAELTDWQITISYGGTKRDNVVIIRSHGSLTGKSYHRKFPNWKSNRHCKCRWLMLWRIPNYSELFTDGWQISAASTCVVVFCPAGGDSSVSLHLGNHLPIYRNSFTCEQNAVGQKNMKKLFGILVLCNQQRKWLRARVSRYCGRWPLEFYWLRWTRGEAKLGLGLA